ncbi:MAG: SDR family NAD(P)-dependent oxidoreductase [Melioribacteraceae bacterium]|nr:SDR family NAD(P)-dependent oxidoreductase [Melioribacteraceae bacterium]MCF8266008.1 SDR family NAD(P)-dependent oxidoreductase [Melioribacteraceae bacterium]MCF8413073.1 SDR family NAD(P)-dependent oxidoreductase [Melioribacteraceae bacterium]
MKSFQNKYGEYALITGGSSGIGKALAFESAKKGLNVILVARKEDELNKTSEAISRQYGVKVKTISADLSNDEGINKIINESENLKVGLFIPAAGYETNGLFSKTNLEKEMMVININVVSTLKLTHYFSKKMVSEGKGGILLVSSLSGHMPNPFFSNYAGAKAYVLNLGVSLAGELKEKGVDVAVLSPGLTNTPMAKNTGVDWNKTPMKKMEAAKVAEIALNKLGKKISIVPGGRNNFMAFMAKYMTPFSIGTKMNAKMIRGALSPDRL